MDDPTRRAALALVHALDRAADAESFSDDDAWALMQDLVDTLARPGRGLNQVEVAAFRNFGASIGIRPGAPRTAYVPGLENAFGASRISDEDLALLVTWAHGEVNGGGRAPGCGQGPAVRLSAEYGVESTHKKTDLN